MKKILLILFSLQFILSATIYAQTNASTKEKENVVLAKEKLFIEVIAIPNEALKVSVKLEKIEKLLKNKEKLVDIHKALPSYTKSVTKILKDPTFKKIKQLNIRYLRKKYTELSVYLSQFNEWNEFISKKIDIYNEQRKVLKIYTELWDETKIHATKEKAPKAIIKQINSVIKLINKVSKDTKKYFDILLTDSNTIITKNLEIKNMMQKLIDAEKTLSSEIFLQNELPLITTFEEQSFSILKYIENTIDTFIDSFVDFKNYFESHEKKSIYFILNFIMLSIFIGYFNYLYRNNNLFVRKESLSKKRFFFINRPFSTFIILISLLNNFLFPNMPKVVMDVNLLITLIPVLRILQTVVSQKIIKYFYFFFILYTLFLVQKYAPSFALESRVVNIVLSAILISFILTILKNKALDHILKPVLLSYAYKLFVFFAALLVISIASNFYGTVLLSNNILASIFTIFYSSLIFYTISIILTGYVVVLLRRRMASATNMREKFSLKVEKTTTMFIKFIMIAWWFKVTMKTVGLYSYITQGYEYFLDLSWKISNTTISIEAIFNFIIIVTGTWLLARFINTLLEVEIFSRFKFPRGLPTAIKTTLNYTIIIVGTIISLSSLGVSPEQFTLVFGALGVGIGFGLRNIIANFVSGIIMVFERPIQIGDTIEVADTMGVVQKIGARSSTVETFDGSEVIIPNADFIAKEITNWTLSDERRRKILEFKVDFDSDIEEVLSIMKDVANNHPDVLDDPKPVATFNGFGEYYINFKLYFWLTNNLIVAQSDIALGVYKKLKTANIKMPMPKQEQLNKTSPDNPS